VALHHRALTVALLAALAAAAGACRLRSGFVVEGGGDAAVPPDAGACGTGTFPRCEMDDLVECAGGALARTACPLGCNALAVACNDCAPGSETCSGGVDLTGCDLLGQPFAEPCLAMSCVAAPAPACAPCAVETAATCFGGQILSCSGGVQGTVDACPLGYGCSDAGPPAGPYCNECPPSQLFCGVNGDLQNCDSTGTIPTIDTPCSPLGCSDAPAPHCNECMPDLPVCGTDGNVYACPDGIPGATLLETCDGALCGGGACRTPLVPSNVPADVLAAATAFMLGNLSAALATCAAHDTIVVDADDGSITCWMGTSPAGTARAAAAGLDAGIYHDVVPQGAGAPDLGVLVFADFDLAAGERIRVRGTNAIAFVATGCALVEGDVLAGGGVYGTAFGVPFDLAVDDGTIGGGNDVPGPGGFAAGNGSSPVPAEGPGAGASGAPSASDLGGAGGGGHGGRGGDGGDATNPTPDALGGAGGDVYSCGGGGLTPCRSATDYDVALVPLVGGSGGGGAGAAGMSGRGGAGGGAIEIVSLGTCGVTVGAGSVIDAGGEGGRSGDGTAQVGGGGGAGGAILVEGYRVVVLGALTANGGGGGAGDDSNGGGSPGAADRGAIDATRAAGRTSGMGGGDGGDGGAGTFLAGDGGQDDSTAPGGGGGAAGRIRINAFDFLFAAAPPTISPSTSTSAATLGTPVTE